MRLIACSFLVFLNPFFIGWAASSPDQRAIEDLAPKVKFLCTSDFLYDYDRPSLAPSLVTEYQLWRQVWEDPALRTENLLLLLHHPDAKVRTLAVVALYAKEDPRILPDLVELAEDRAVTFPCPEPRAQITYTDLLAHLQTQQVGQIASAAVNFYLQKAGYSYGIHGVQTEPGFDAYWSAHKNRTYSASWFAVRLSRAHGSQTAERIAAIRRDIANLPQPDRELTLLWATGESADGEWNSPLATQPELVQACKDLRHDHLLKMLAHEETTNDPDLHYHKRGNWPYSQMELFALQHCGSLFSAEDATTLLNDEQEERKYLAKGIFDPLLSPWWAIAAARVDPKNAKPILHSAFTRFSGDTEGVARGELAAAMWELGGASETKFVLDWFYSDQADGCGGCIYPRSQFLIDVSRQTKARHLFPQIVEDSRFEKLDWPSLDKLGTIVSEWTNPPVIDQQLREKTWHPYGERSIDWDKAAREYPKETAQLRIALAEWRTKIRASVPKWTDRTSRR